jgi:hypothetical protein
MREWANCSSIADFRRDNGPAIRAACAQFVVLCRNLNLFTRVVVALDGSRFKAVNNRDKNFTVAKVGKRIEQVEASIARYLAALDRADGQDDDVAEAKTVRLKDKIEGLRRQMQSLKEMGRRVEAAPDKQVSLTDPDARSMATSGKGTGMVGCNVQMAVDAEHHLIVAHEVTNIGSDRAQLTAMGQKAMDATGCEQLTVLADRGYYNGDEGAGLPGRAAGLEQAGRAGGEVAIVVDIVLSVRTHLSPGQTLAGRTCVAVLLGVVDEVRHGEEATLGVGQMSVSWECRAQCRRRRSVNALLHGPVGISYWIGFSPFGWY